MNLIDIKVILLFTFRLLRRGGITFQKINNLLGNLWSLFRRSSQAAAFPSLLVIEPTRGCNIACTGCGYLMRGLMKPAAMLDLENLEKIFNEAGKHLFLVALHLGGEPFLHKQLIEIAKYIVTQKVGIIINTNGNYQLSEEQLVQLVNSGADLITFSISGMTQDVYNEYHRGGSIQLVKENIIALEKAKAEVGQNTPKIMLRYLQHETNAHEVEAAREFAKKHQLFAFDLRKIEAEYNLANFAEVKKNIKQLQKDVTLPICWNLWLLAEIKTTGDLLPCCYEWYEIPVIGNIFQTDSLRSVWNSDLYQQLRLGFSKQGGGIPPACYLCRIKLGFQAGQVPKRMATDE